LWRSEERFISLRWFVSLTAVPLRWFYIAHGYSVLRTGLRGRALTGGPQWPAARCEVAGEMRQSCSVSQVLYRSRLFLGFASGLRAGARARAGPAQRERLSDRCLP